MEDDAQEMGNRASSPPPLSSSSSKPAVTYGYRIEMGSPSEAPQPQESTVRSSSPLLSSGVLVRHAVSNCRSLAGSAFTNDGGEEQNGDKGKHRGSSTTAKSSSRGGETVATATTSPTPILADVPGSSSSAPSALSLLSHGGISAASSVYNVRSISPGSGSGQATGMLKSLPVFPPRVFRAAGIPPPSAEAAATTPETLVTPPAPGRLTMTVTGTGHTVTPLSSPAVGPTPAAATLSTSPEGIALSAQLTCFAIGGSRRRNSISVPTSPFPAEGDKAANSFTEDGVGSPDERWRVDPHHLAPSDHNSHAAPSAAGSANEAATRSPQNADQATEDDSAALNVHPTASTSASSAPPFSPSHAVRSLGASASSAAGVVTSAATVAHTPSSHNVPIPPSIPVASQGSKSTRNASNLSLSTDHVRNPLFIGQLPSPIVSPVATSAAGGGAGGSTSPANRGGAALSRRDSQSPSPSLRFATHDPYNASVIVATPLMSAVPRTTSFASHRSPSTTSTGLGIAHMRIWSASALASGNAVGGYGGVAAVDSGASFSYCAVANSDTMSVKSSMADVSRGTHDGIIPGPAGGGPSKLPSPSTGEHFLCSPQGPYGGYAVPQTARYAHDVPPARTSAPYCEVGESAAEAPHEGAYQQECEKTPPGQSSYGPHSAHPFQQHEEQGQHVQHPSTYVPPNEQQQPEHHHRQGLRKQHPPRPQYEPLWDEQHQHPPHPPPAQEAPGHYQSFEPMPRRHQQGYPCEYPQPCPEQQQHQNQQHERPCPHQREAYDYPEQSFDSSQQQHQQPQQNPYPQTPELHGLCAYQAYAELPQHRLHSMPPPQEQQYQPPQVLQSYMPQPHPPQMRALQPQRQQPPQQPHRTQRLGGERSSNAGATHHNWNGPRKRTAQDVLPGFFSVDTIQLGDQTHLVVDRNGVPHEHSEQPQSTAEASNGAALLTGGSSMDYTPPPCRTSHEGYGPSAALELDNTGRSPALTAMPFPPVGRRQPQQLSRSFSVYYDATPAHGTLGDYNSGSRARAESAAAVPRTSSFGSDDDEAVLMHGGAMHSSQPPRAARHIGSASVMTVGGMMVAQPPRMEAPAVSRASNPRAGYAMTYRGGSSGEGNTNMSGGTGSGSSGPSNKSVLLNNGSGCMANVEAIESGSCSSANGGGGAPGMTHVYNVDSSIDVCGSPGAPGSTSPSAGLNAQVGVRSGGGYTSASVTTPTVIYGAYPHYPSMCNYAMGSTGVHVSQPARRTTSSATAMSSSQDGPNECRPTSSAPFAPPLPRSAGAMEGRGGVKGRPSHGQGAIIHASLSTQQHPHRHPSARGSAADESQTMSGGEESSSPHIALPNRCRFSIPSMNQPNDYGGMQFPQQQQQYGIAGEGSNSNIGGTPANAARGTGAMGCTTGHGASVSGAPLQDQDAGRAATALMLCPSEGPLIEPSRGASEKAEVVKGAARAMEPNTPTSGTGVPATQRRRRPHKK
ncbi:hypothetical protein LSCM1_05955 [Leishmania martiniquensis]|uniref:Uncharacterized protein n=1 Tax=Leishmania martiniquensis TaxID=1580590 RepID=A0A836KVA0_9TRYP|nr:hypothetical protein LSCM1_05955 [Leishmania martiniquensis]